MVQTLEFQLQALTGVFSRMSEYVMRRKLNERQGLILTGLFKCLPNQIVDWSTECDRNPTTPTNYLLTKIASIEQYSKFIQQVIPKFINIPQESSNALIRAAKDIDTLIDSSGANQIGANEAEEAISQAQLVHICQRFNLLKKALMSFFESNCVANLGFPYYINHLLSHIVEPTISSAGVSQIRIGAKDREEMVKEIEDEVIWQGNHAATLRAFIEAFNLGWVECVIMADYVGPSCFKDTQKIMRFIEDHTQEPITTAFMPLVEDVSFKRGDIESICMSVVFPMASADTPVEVNQLITGISAYGGIPVKLAGSDTSIRAGRAAAMLYLPYFNAICNELLEMYIPSIIKILKGKSDTERLPLEVEKTIKQLTNHFSNPQEAVAFIDKYYKIRLQLGAGSSPDRQGAYKPAQKCMSNLRLPKDVDGITTQPATNPYIDKNGIIRLAMAEFVRELTPTTMGHQEYDQLAFIGNEFHESFKSFTEDPNWMALFFKLISAKRIAKIKTGSRKAGQAVTETKNHLEWWGSQRAIGKVGMIRMLMIMHNIYGAAHVKDPTKINESSLPDYVRFLLSNLTPITTGEPFPPLMQSYDKLTDSDISLMLSYWGEFQGRVLTRGRKQPEKVLHNFSVLNNVTDTIIRLGNDLETVETCLEKCNNGNEITKAERTTIKQIEQQFQYSGEVSILSRLEALQGKLQQNLEDIFRLYASAYPR